ncbi:diguanylate cyclase [Pseudoalteromonas haloplanktis]|uniref:diguanylate cyclase n=1 Tax=Pseudoalteromonas haloplanktis TaxID=228 RepID=A0ABU1BCW3_PSEHA|nr:MULTISPECIES: diguanylate cyclase [Pseudoalteromonas]MDQ9092165.1 diguanylate cyclase [Pseudoalteromonas haloplanktis]BDF96103.1 deoxynucleoside kinase [Pseudoalteromonas sp. KAN5]
MKRVWLLLCSLLLISFSSHATNIVLDKNFKRLQDIPFEYSLQPLTLNQAKLAPNPQWQQLTDQALNLGVTDQAVWLRLQVSNTENSPLALLLSIDNPLLDKVAVYHYDGQSTLLFKEIGDALPLNNRQIKTESLLVKLVLPPNSDSKLLLRVESKNGVRVPLSLWQHDEYLKYKSKFNLMYGLLVGFILSLAITCLVLFGFSRKHYFALSGGILITLWLLLIYLYGFGYRYFHPSVPALQQVAIPTMLMLTAYLFKPLLEQLRKNINVYLHPVHNWCNRLLGISLLFIWLLPPNAMIIISLAAPTVVMFMHITAITLDIRTKRTQPLIALLTAAIVYFSALLYLISVVFNVYDFNTRGLPFVFFSFLICSLSLSFATIKHYLIERDAQVAAQQSKIAQSEAHDALLQERLALQEQARLDLEANIEERTFELQVTLRELEEKNRALEQINMEDPLTKIKNRRYFDKKLVMDLRRSRREQTPLSVIMLDIDHFKSINDTYGHLIGDQTIRAVADIIKNRLKRPLDEVVRYGGEEFVVLLPNTVLSGAIELAEQIRQAIMDTAITVANTEIKFTISAGVYSAIAEDINNPGLFTGCADQALYHAKQSGRNRVVSFPILD